MISIRFCSLSGKFALLETRDFATLAEAHAAIVAYATAAGYTNVKEASDFPDDGFRWTGKTPGGRSGRNVAFGDYL
jgi:hypothetical protein